MIETPDLNLDDIVKDERVLKLGGKTFKFYRMGVHQQLKFYDLNNQLRKSNNSKAYIDVMKKIVILLDEIVPGLSKSGVNVTPEHAMKLVEYSASSASSLRKVSAEKKSGARKPKTEQASQSHAS